MAYVTASNWSAGCIHGCGSYKAQASRQIGATWREMERRELDLSSFLDSMGFEWCERTARRWKVSNGFIRAYRARASQRRFHKRIRGER